MTEEAAKATHVHCLLHWANATPDEIFLTQPYPDGRSEDISWAQAADQVARVAGHLRALDLPPGSCIALLGRNSAHWILADLAIWMAGHVTVPLYPTLNAETANYVLEHSESKLLMLGKMDGSADGWNELKDALPQDLPVISLPMSPREDTPSWERICQETEPEKEPKLPGVDDLATLVYTSGSTGRPKGVMHSFRTMLQGAHGLYEIFPVDQNDRMLSYLPLAHVAERAAVETSALYFGFHIYFANSLDTFQEDLQRARPTLFFSVPRLWMKFYLGICEKLPPKKQKVLFSIPILSGLIKKKILKQLGLEHCRAALTGAAPLPGEIVSWYRKLGLELLEVYGMSENFGYSHANRPGRAKIGTVGVPNPGVECRIDKETSEVLVKSPSQMLGYYKNEEITKEDLTGDGFLKTGDMGEIDGEGYLRITGRVKDIFKTAKGKYVVPVPIENRFNHPKVEVVCVAGANQPQPCALVLLSDEARQELASGGDRQQLEAELEALLTEVNTGCEDHEKLACIVIAKEPWTMDNGFLTPTMKIKRNVIESHYQNRFDAWYEQKKKVVWE